MSLNKSDRDDLERLRRAVGGWFADASLEAVMGPAGSQTERIARQWVARSGKRWRPLLAAGTYLALAGGDEMPPGLHKVGVAVECFHKASLVHDDIEDHDNLRDGRSTLHAQYGVGVALNVGDLLLGEGYRMVAECDAPTEARARMIEAAVRGHRMLCLGQGAELCWMREPTPLSCREALDIFRLKTAPAFGVALHLGALYAGADGEVSAALTPYSDCLGVAYQIHDDLTDFAGGSDDLRAMRPSILLAMAHEAAQGLRRDELVGAMSRRRLTARQAQRIREIVSELGVEARAAELLETHRRRAIRSLSRLAGGRLKAMLRAVVAEMFQDGRAS